MTMHAWMRVAGPVIGLAAVMLLAGPKPAAAQTCGEFVRVEQGDTLVQIAARCGTTVDALLGANNWLRDPDRLRVGAIVFMPLNGLPVRAASRRWEIVNDTDVAPGRADTANVYTVRAGDTLEAIAERFGVTVEDLIEANPSLPDARFIAVGTRLVIPEIVFVEEDYDPLGPAGAERATISPINGAPGSQVLLTAFGFEPGEWVYLAVAREAEPHHVVGRARANERGHVITGITIPARAQDGERWVVLVLDDARAVKAISNPFTVDRNAVPEGRGPVRRF